MSPETAAVPGPTPLEAIRAHARDMLHEETCATCNGRGAVLLGLVGLMERDIARLRAASALVSAACTYVDADEDADGLEGLYDDLVAARYEYMRALRRIDDATEAP